MFFKNLCGFKTDSYFDSRIKSMRSLFERKCEQQNHTFEKKFHWKNYSN